MTYYRSTSDAKVAEAAATTLRRYSEKSSKIAYGQFLALGGAVAILAFSPTPLV